MVKDGDTVNCTVAELQPLRAEPEDIPLDIVFEDDHVLVVNKPAHMVINSSTPSSKFIQSTDELFGFVLRLILFDF